MKTLSRHIAIVAAATLFLGGCAGDDVTPPQAQVTWTAEKQALDQQLSAIDEAKKEGLGYFAPTTFSKAKDTVTEAKELLAEADSKKEFSQKLRESKQWLAKAETSRSIAEKELAEILEYKAKLTKLKAAALYPDEYENFNEDLNDIIEKIDEGEGVASFENRVSVQAEGRELYSKAVIQGSLYKVADILGEMEESDLASYAPKAYAKAQDTYKNSMFTIQQFPDNEEVIGKASVAALKDAEVALLIAKESRKVSESDERSVEFYVEQIHGKLNDIYGKLDAEGSILTRPMPQKLGQIDLKVTDLKTKIDTLGQENSKQKATLAQLRSETESLQSSLKNVEAKGGDLQKQYSATALELSKMTKENQQLQQDLNRTSNDLASAKSLLVSVQGDSQKNKGEAASLRSKNSKLAQEVEKLKVKIVSQGAEIKEKDAAISTLTKERDTLQSKASEAAEAVKEAVPEAAPAP